jgi:hypothetical protein
MSELLREWRRSFRPPMPDAFRETARAIMDTIDGWMWRDLIGSGPVMIQNTTYQPYEDGEWCFLTPCWPWMEDIVAWHPATPGRWALRIGTGTMLGDVRYDEPLRVHRTPLAWLRAGGEGVCFLDRSSIAPTLWGHGQRIIADDVAHMRELRDICRRAEPRISTA